MTTDQRSQDRLDTERHEAVMVAVEQDEAQERYDREMAVARSLTQDSDPKVAGAADSLARTLGEIGLSVFGSPRCLYCNGPLTNDRDQDAHCHTTNDPVYPCIERAREMAH